jgi:predicted nucleic acid-binding protein
MAMYFYDSYAVIEYFRGNEKYMKYFVEHSGVLTQANLIEIHHAILKQFSEADANRIAKILSQFVVVPTLDVIIEASKFRLRKRDISFSDAIGYVYAKMHNMKFLTGDKEFESMENVEFVK